MEPEKHYLPFVDLLSNEWWDIPVGKWSQGLMNLEMNHAAARQQIIKDRVGARKRTDKKDSQYENLGREIAVYAFVQDVAGSMAGLFGQQIDNWRKNGSWRRIDGRRAAMIEESINKHEMVAEMGDYKDELGLLRKSIDTTGERNFHKLGARFSELAWKKYIAGMPVLYHDTHSYMRDMREGLGGKLSFIEPDLRVYLPVVDSELESSLRIQQGVLNSIHAGRDKKIRPMILDYVMSAGWLPSMTSGEAMYSNTFMVVRNLLKDLAKVDQVVKHLGLNISQVKQKQSVMLLMTAHEAAHTYYWKRNQPFADAIYEEVFADVAAVITLLESGISIDEAMVSIIASYQPAVKLERGNLAENDWGYAMSANLIVNMLAESVVVGVDSGVLTLRREHVKEFGRRLKEVHRNLWSKDRLTMEKIKMAKLTDEGLALAKWNVK